MVAKEVQHVRCGLGILFCPLLTLLTSVQLTRILTTLDGQIPSLSLPFPLRHPKSDRMLLPFSPHVLANRWSGSMYVQMYVQCIIGKSLVWRQRAVDVNAAVSTGSDLLR
jgi:hypothetical protein